MKKPERFDYLEIQKRLAATIPDNPGKPKPYQMILPPGAPPFPVDAENPLTDEGVQLGRWLFYDPLLSRDHNVACASCHIQRLAFTDGRRVSPGVDGENVGRNAMSLVNLAWGRDFFWDGRAKDLRDLSLLPIQHPKEMAQPLDRLIWKLSEHPVYPKLFAAAFGDRRILLDRVSRALTQFLRSLVSFNAPVDLVRMAENGHYPEDKLTPGMKSYLLKNMPPRIQMITSKCGQCHNDAFHGSRALYGGTRMRNNGLPGVTEASQGAYSVSPQAIGLFKVPELRNIGLTAPYMHDGRFSTLDEVLEHYSEHVTAGPHLSNELQDSHTMPLRLKMTKEEMATVKYFMEMMTDQSFVTDIRYGNPFLENASLQAASAPLPQGYYLAMPDQAERTPEQLQHELNQPFPHLVWSNGNGDLVFVKPTDRSGFITFFSKPSGDQLLLVNAMNGAPEWKCTKIIDLKQNCTNSDGGQGFSGKFFSIGAEQVKRRGLYHSAQEFTTAVNRHAAGK